MRNDKQLWPKLALLALLLASTTGCKEAPATVAPVAASPTKPPDNSPLDAAAMAERGKVLFAEKACSACHGVAGSGGVANANAISGSVPALNKLAERMMLDSKEQSDKIATLLGSRQNLTQLASPPFETYPRFLAQYQNIRNLMQNGGKPGRLDPSLPDPPLQMPSWRAAISDRDLDALLVYLISLQNWDE